MKILDYNHCQIKNCECGWNVSIGGTSEEELKELKALLGPIEMEDVTNYEEKIRTEKFQDN